ncbi:Rv3654c family TadE-like protein [Nonomuraea terrae]|uniref:Rv3654c family TadE-like protein n=1 Tax=Nonomuraea terrae TaxID=2530383 RepID=UPI0037B89242
MGGRGPVREHGSASGCASVTGRGLGGEPGSSRERGVAGGRDSAGERGSATFWGVALMGLLMAIAMVFATVGSVRVARHRVTSAADLSALAAARLAVIDPEGACDRASALAEQNGVELTRCTLTGDVVDVWTALSISVPLSGRRTVTGRSRAGPADPSPAAEVR